MGSVSRYFSVAPLGCALLVEFSTSFSEGKTNLSVLLKDCPDGLPEAHARSISCKYRRQILLDEN
jgi:hypothetical protein